MKIATIKSSNNIYMYIILTHFLRLFNKLKSDVTFFYILSHGNAKDGYRTSTNPIPYNLFYLSRNKQDSKYV